MIESSEPEVFLTNQERLELIRNTLLEIIQISCDENIRELDRMDLIKVKLGDIMVHIEAGGGELGLNQNEHSVISSLMWHSNDSALRIAYKCARLLGALNQPSRYPESWDNQPIIIKNAFLKDLQNMLDIVIKDNSVKNLLKLEELISGFLVHESLNSEDEVKNVCLEIEDCIYETLYYGFELSLVRLSIQKNTTVTMRGKLSLGLS
ncbi:hypothetical protein J7J83_00330 [bacterium]|nr:hypothetical protein [bacterium]